MKFYLIFHRSDHLLLANEMNVLEFVLIRNRDVSSVLLQIYRFSFSESLEIHRESYLNTDKDKLNSKFKTSYPRSATGLLMRKSSER